MKLKYLNRAPDVNNSSGGEQNASNELITDAKKVTPGKDITLTPGTPGGPAVDPPAELTDAEKEALNNQLIESQKASDEKNQLDKAAFIKDIATEVAGQIKKDQSKSTAPRKPKPVVVLTNEQKLKKYGVGYVEVKNKAGQKNIFTALGWKNLGKNKNGWVPDAQTPPEVQSMK